MPTTNLTIDSSTCAASPYTRTGSFDSSSFTNGLTFYATIDMSTMGNFTTLLMQLDSILLGIVSPPWLLAWVHYFFCFFLHCLSVRSLTCIISILLSNIQQLYSNKSKRQIHRQTIFQIHNSLMIRQHIGRGKSIVELTLWENYNKHTMTELDDIIAGILDPQKGYYSDSGNVTGFGQCDRSKYGSFIYDLPSHSKGRWGCGWVCWN